MTEKEKAIAYDRLREAIMNPKPAALNNIRKATGLGIMNLKEVLSFYQAYIRALEK